MSKRSYWCYRVDTSRLKFFWNELIEARLRQGWGWDSKQDLRNFQLDEGAGRNRPMFNNVKKGDVLLIPQLPNWGDVALVEATEDWNKGYRFDIDKNTGDFGHIFPAKYLKKFTRNNENVTGNIRSTLKNPSRFWSINHYSEDVERLLLSQESDLSKRQDHESRLESSIGNVFNEVFDEKLFAEKLFDKLSEQFTREEWEYALVYGLKQLFPYYQIDRVGGKEEKNHGTDILIKLPSILSNHEYAIAIQVKDYDGFVGEEVIRQINRADAYWATENLKLIEKIVIITKAKKEENVRLLEHDKSVKFIFAHELKGLLSEIGKSFIGMK
ncbi:hypothetical protein [Pontibacter indicus]|uniref:Restriction endonuclease n=1 Tax=Pontibacter indicus TaxID=1317125 RepID=A0A1R3XRZ0_9BACT|nr:hypothetical protein [Pontibacter indicus]SIT94656.1 hypothetical protein SAMN05444128_3697 [Pontibacter indicus]